LSGKLKGSREPGVGKCACAAKKGQVLPGTWKMGTDQRKKEPVQQQGGDMWVWEQFSVMNTREG